MLFRLELESDISDIPILNTLHYWSLEKEKVQKKKDMRSNLIDIELAVLGYNHGNNPH